MENYRDSRRAVSAVFKSWVGALRSRLCSGSGGPPLLTNARILQALIALSVLLFHFGEYWSATWWSKWTLMTILFSVILSYWAARRSSFAYMPLMTWVLLSSSVVGFQYNRLPLSSLFPPEILSSVGKWALYTWMTTIASIWAISIFDRRFWRGAVDGLLVIWGVGTIAYCFQPDLPMHGWEFGNPSEGASLLACLLPFVWAELRARGWVYPPLAWLATSVAIYRTHTAIPAGVLAAVTAAYWFHRSHKAWLYLCALPPFLAQWYLSGKPFFDTNGRYPVWKMAYEWCRDHGFLWFGLGAGAVQTLVPVLQVQTHTRLPDFFVWLHSDWLQIVIEFGWVGLVCTLIALIHLLWKAHNHWCPENFASLMGFVALGAFGYPLRLPIHFFCLLMVCCLIEKASVPEPSEHRELPFEAQEDLRARKVSEEIEQMALELHRT